MGRKPSTTNANKVVEPTPNDVINQTSEASINVEEKVVRKETASTASEKIKVVKNKQVENTKEVQHLNSLLNEYKKLVEAQNGIGNATSRAIVLDKFMQIANFVLSPGTGTRPVMERMYQFFVTERNGLVGEDLVFQGARLLEASARTRLEMFYVVWSSLVDYKLHDGPFFPCNYAMSNILRSNVLVAFVKEKMNSRTI